MAFVHVLKTLREKRLAYENNTPIVSKSEAEKIKTDDN